MRAQGPASRSASSRRADRHCSTRLPAPGPGRQLARAAPAPPPGRPRRHRRRRGPRPTFLCICAGSTSTRIDRAHTGRPGGDHPAPQVGVPDLGPHEQQHVGGVDRGVGGGQAHRRAERRGVPLVQDALAVHGGQDGHAPVGQPADLLRSGSRSPAGDDQRALSRPQGIGHGLEDRLRRPDGAGRGAGTDRTPLPGPLQDVDRHLEVHGAGAPAGEPLEDVRDRLGDLVGALHADAAAAHRIERRLLVLHLVQPADVRTDPAPGGARGDRQRGHGVRVGRWPAR